MLNLINKVERVLLNAQIKNCKESYGAFRTTTGNDRYPFIYMRDNARIVMAVDLLGHYDKTELFFEFVKRIQGKKGEWVQRYDSKGKKAVDRSQEVDCTALVIIAACHHYKLTNNENFLDYMWGCLVKASDHILSKRHGNTLIYSHHAIHENKHLERGYDIWTNSCCCRAFKDFAELAEKRDKILAKKLRKEYKKQLKAIKKEMWNGETFLKTLKIDGREFSEPDISMISPIWQGIIKPKSRKAKKTLKYIEILWDKEIGGYNRFENFNRVKDWHWYDGGHGSWMVYTAVMANITNEDKCFKWISNVWKTYGSFPEHIASKSNYEKWKKNEYDWSKWLKNGSKQAERYAKQWRFGEGDKQKVYPWVKSLIWAYAEVAILLKEKGKCSLC